MFITTLNDHGYEILFGYGRITLQYSRFFYALMFPDQFVCMKPQLRALCAFS